MIIEDFLKSVQQLGDPRFRRVLFGSLVLTILLLAGFVYGTGWLLAWLIPGDITIPWIGQVTFLDNLGAGVGVGAGLVLSIFLMVPVATLFVGAFLDQVAGAVEARHYPHLPEARGAGFWDGLADALRFLILLILANLLALVLYLLFAPLAPVIFWLVNGYLLGVEYFQLAAMRRLSRKQSKTLRRKHILEIWMAGVLMAIPLSVPILNLVIPILGAATFTHLFHRLAKSG